MTIKLHKKHVFGTSIHMHPSMYWVLTMYQAQGWHWLLLGTSRDSNLPLPKLQAQHDTVMHVLQTTAQGPKGTDEWPRFTPRELYKAQSHQARSSEKCSQNVTKHVSVQWQSYFYELWSPFPSEDAWENQTSPPWHRLMRGRKKSSVIRHEESVSPLPAQRIWRPH